jgi:hypothetical protein
MKKDFVKILKLDNEVEAQLMKNSLEERNIPHMVRSYHDSAYDGIYQFQKGWGVILAPESFKEEIMEIYNDIQHLDNE